MNMHDLDFGKTDKQLFHEFLIDRSMAGFTAQVYEMVNFAGVPERKAPTRVKKQFMRWLAAKRVCLADGHDWEVDGYFGTDSGSEWATCKRCGEGHSRVYY